MKYLIILITLITLASCENTPIKVNNRAKETTVELINESLQDTTYNLYRVVVKDNTIYCINEEDDLVSYKASNQDGSLLFWTALSLIKLMFLIIAGMIVFD